MTNLESKFFSQIVPVVQLIMQVQTLGRLYKGAVFNCRKRRLQTGRPFTGWFIANTVLRVFKQALLPEQYHGIKAQGPDGEGILAGNSAFELFEERNWKSGAYGRWRQVREGVLRASRAKDGC